MHKYMWQQRIAMGGIFFLSGGSRSPGIDIANTNCSKQQLARY